MKFQTNAVIVLGVFLLGACGSDEQQGTPDKAEMSIDQGPDLAPVQMEPDLGLDMPQPDLPGEPCGGACQGTARVCDLSRNVCIECLGDKDCAGATPVCDVDTNRCVACNSSADCRDSGATHCTDAHTCVPCVSNNDCGWIDPNVFICDNGTCKECTYSENTCGNFSCDPTSGTCSNTMKKSVEYSDECKSDSECMELDFPPRIMECIPARYEGQSIGSYCMISFSSDCREVAKQRETRTSVDGHTAEYCFPNENIQTINAVYDSKSLKRCTPQMHDECGIVGLDDGYCYDWRNGKLDPPLYVCRVFCIDDSDCTNGSSCRRINPPPTTRPNLGLCTSNQYAD